MLAVATLIKTVLKKLSVPLMIAILSVIMAMFAINFKLLFGPILGIFGYNSNELRNLKGWKGWGRVWRGWNRLSFFDGILLDWFDGRYYFLILEFV